MKLKTGASEGELVAKWAGIDGVGVATAFSVDVDFGSDALYASFSYVRSIQDLALG